MTRQTFKTNAVLRLEVEQTPAGLANLIRNAPDTTYNRQETAPTAGQTAGSGWGWVTDQVGVSNVFGTTVPTGRPSGDVWVYWAMTNGTPNAFYSEDWAQAAGEWAAARLVGAAVATVVAWARLRFEWLDVTGAVIGSSTQTGYTQWTQVDTTGGVVQSLTAQQAPAGTVRARLRVDLYGNNTGGNSAGGTIYMQGVTAAKASTAAALTGLGYIDPAGTYTNVIGPTHSINVQRSALNLGILTAEILDASLDPSQATLVRPGKRCRLMALDNATATWKALFVGTVLQGKTSYDPKRTDAKRARITLTAVDAVQQLSQVTRTLGVSSFDYIYKPLQGSRVPYWLNTGISPPVYYPIPARSMLDQIAMVRDSTLAYAWVSRRGILQLFQKASMPTTPITTLNESQYSALSIDYDTDRCINIVNVKLRRTNAATGGEVEVAYGPYVNQASVEQWGAHSRDFTVIGITDSDAAASAYAAPILAANSTPAVRINSVEIPIRDATDIVAAKAFLDVMDLVTVANTNAGISQNMNITGLEHSIDSGKWQMRLDFEVNNSVASPTVIAPPPGPGGGGVAPDVNWNGLAVTANASGTIIYHKQNGFVSLQFAGSKSATSGAILATLPPGYRPSVQLIFPCVQAGGVMSGIYITTDGNIRSDFGTGMFGGCTFPV